MRQLLLVLISTTSDITLLSTIHSLTHQQIVKLFCEIVCTSRLIYFTPYLQGVLMYFHNLDIFYAVFLSNFLSTTHYEGWVIGNEYKSFISLFVF